MRSSKQIKRSIDKRFKKLQRKSRNNVTCIPAKVVVLLVVLAVFINTLGTTIVTAAEVVKARVNVETRLNLREEPSLDAKVICKLSKNEVVTVVSQKDDWAKVETENGNVGYVSTDYIILKNDEKGKSQIDQSQDAYNYVDIDSEKYELISTSEITSGSSKNRDFNMTKACEAINGLKLESGEVFAWYDVDKYFEGGIGYIKASGVVGPASKETGYKEATVISNGKYVKGYGGGVCQVSTAVYNALYNLEITPIEHHHHTLKSSYVKEGMDATVAYSENQANRKNFVFINTKDYPIVFEAYQNSGKVTVNIYCYKENE